MVLIPREDVDTEVATFWASSSIQRQAAQPTLLSTPAGAPIVGALALLDSSPNWKELHLGLSATWSVAQGE